MTPAVAGAAAASADDCEGSISLSCTGLLPPPPETAPAPEPEPAPAPAPAPSEPAPADGLTAEGAVDRLLSLIDADRRALGLAGLAETATLAGVADTHSRSMADQGEIWHNDDLFTEATKARLGIRLVGENVASNVSIDDAHRRLMASPGHRANLVSSTFVQVGVGVARAGDTWYITEVFATPVAPAAAPASGAPTTRSPARPPAPSVVPAAPEGAPAAPAPSLVTDAEGPGETPATVAAPSPAELPVPPSVATRAAAPARSLAATGAAIALLAVAGLGLWARTPVRPDLRLNHVSGRMGAWMRSTLRPAAGLPHPRRLGAP